MISNFPDVDSLMELAKNNPEELERLRQAEIDNLIGSAPESTQRRLRGLQFQIDCKRQLHPNGMGACMAITEMMFDSLTQLNRVLHGEEREGNSKAAEDNHSAVIEFPAFGS